MALSKRKAVPEKGWFVDAARIMVRRGLPLRQAVSELEINDLTTQDCEEIYQSENFQKILWAERQRFQREVANTPGRDKTSAIGLLMLLVQKLIDAQEWDKAVVALEKLMKAEGWTGAESNINVFAGLTAKDYADLLKEIDGDTRETSSRKGVPAKDGFDA